MANENILVIEDEHKISRVIRLELEHEGYRVAVADTGKKGLDDFYASEYDLVLLDIMLPELSGMEVLRRIRRSQDETPVIMLTAKNTIPDKVSGLDQGANDYIPKPFEIEELFARIRACLRTSQARHTGKNAELSEEIQVSDLHLNESTRDVTRSEQHIELTPREFDLLVFLMKNENHVLTREQILDAVWGFDYFGDTNVVDVYVRYLRQKVDKRFDHPLIQTVRGVGYTLRSSNS